MALRPPQISAEQEAPVTAIQTVAILYPGDMGHAVGRALRENGLDVVTCLEGRSPRTRALAEAAGLRALPTIEALVSEAQLVLAILVPDAAHATAARVAEAMRAAGARPAYADCNAVSPATALQIAEIIAGAGGAPIDAGIIGGPPRNGQSPRFYASGEHAPLLAQLGERGLDVRVLPGAVGHASALKMCYAALTKGTSALQIAALTAAEPLGIADALHAELAASQPHTTAQLAGIARVPAKAFRWVGEMEQIAATFASVGVTPKLHAGAADVFRMVAQSPLGDERPETIDAGRTWQQTAAAFAASLQPQAAAEDAPFFAPTEHATPEFTIRAYRPGDGAAMRRAVNSSYEHLRPWMPWASPDQSLAQSEQLARRFAASYLTNSDFVLGVWVGDELAGGTGFHLRGGPVDAGTAEIGMWIGAAHAGRGLGTRALAAMLRWGFSEWPWQRLTWHCDTRNHASRRVAEKNGMRLEGTLRGDALDVEGQRRDTLLFGLLKEEWQGTFSRR
jgi:RimJ/RimL family protein N-acetyltransferase/3-hydroxyisobutyrate dehydrogenase-like beta-hydroxyacid dehydrogenase